MSTEILLTNMRSDLSAAEQKQDWKRVDALFQQINELEPLTAEEIGRQAVAVLQAGDNARAATLTRKALRKAPDSFHLTLQLAKIYETQQRWKEAERAMQKATELDPENVEALRRLAHLYQRGNERNDEAEALLNKARELAPDNIAVCLQLGAIYGNERSRRDEAKAAFERAYEIDPKSPTAVHNLGLLYRFEGELDKSEEFLRRAMALRPRDSAFAFSLGSCLLYQEKIEEAMSWFQRASELDAANTGAKVYVAFCLFHLGRHKEAWAQYEHRLQLDMLRDVRYDRPRWNGNPMNGETLLLLREQGMGDNLQFIRYVPMVAERGARVIVLTPPPLKRLYESLKGVTAVMEGVPEPKHFHRYCPVMSLPYVFGTDDTNVPADVPYLNAPKDVSAAWAEKLAAYPRPRVGLTWRGNPKHSNDEFRSSSLAEMAQLLKVPGITFFSLHKDRNEDEQVLPEGLVDIGSEFEDFADTAGAMENLDLVITVDTSVCHLAGALNVPCWTMLPRSPDFRWGLSGKTTPWYPSMRLYRQETLGDWQPVYDRIATDLGKLAG